jgi:hypothetical protein
VKGGGGRWARLWFLILILSQCPGNPVARAEQPAVGGYRVIKQAPAECGATSTWLMFNHYFGGSGDAAAMQMASSDPRGEKTLPGVCLGKNREACVASADQGVPIDYPTWIKLQRTRPSPSLRHMGRRLSYMRHPVHGNRLLHVEGIYDSTSSAADEKRRGRLETIRHHLEKGRPVIIHLARPMFVSGHYITLVGYEDTDQGRHYLYADTRYPEEGLTRVDESDLVRGARWYARGDRAGPARWNGRFLTFWPMLAGAMEGSETSEEEVFTRGR